jgi:DNA-directed RNA polymerase subunit RPC12/RpoP
MAQCIQYLCSKCGYSIEAWSDGNPYYLDNAGQKQYAYHPDHESLDKCIGNDSPFLCLACGKQFLVDSNNPTDCCPECGSKDISDTFILKGKSCPICKQGKLNKDSNYSAIS